MNPTAERDMQMDGKPPRRFLMAVLLIGLGFVGAEFGMHAAHSYPTPCQDVVTGFSSAMCLSHRPVWPTVFGGVAGLALGAAIWLIVRSTRLGSLTARVVACAICVVLALTLSAAAVIAQDKDAISPPSAELVDRLRHTNCQFATLNGDQYAEVVRHGLTPAAVRAKVFKETGQRPGTLYIGAVTVEMVRDAKGNLLDENVIAYAYERKHIPTTSSGPVGAPRGSIYRDYIEFIDAFTGRSVAEAIL